MDSIKKSILTVTIFIMFIGCFVSLNNVSASTVTIATYGSSTVDSFTGVRVIHPSTDGNSSSVGSTFNATQTGFLSQVRIPAFYLSSLTFEALIQCVVYDTTGTYGTNATPNTILEVSYDKIDTRTDFGSQGQAIKFFNFTSTTQLLFNHSYAFAIEATEIFSVFGTSRYAGLGCDNDNDYSGNPFYYNGTGWNQLTTTQPTFTIYGNTEYGATPTPSPTSGALPQITVITNIIDFLFGTSTGSLGAGFGLIIFFCCAIGFYLISEKSFWGFFAGMNVGFIVNLVGGLWAYWVLVPMILMDIAIILSKTDLATKVTGKQT